MLIRTETSVRLDPTWQFAFGSSWLAPSAHPYIVRRLDDVGDVSFRVSLRTRILYGLKYVQQLYIQAFNYNSSIFVYIRTINKSLSFCYCFTAIKDKFLVKILYYFILFFAPRFITIDDECRNSFTVIFNILSFQ